MSGPPIKRKITEKTVVEEKLLLINKIVKYC